MNIIAPQVPDKQERKKKLVDQHGTYSRYVGRGCRCDECRQARADYMRDYRARKGSAPSRVHYCPACTCEPPAGDA